jgi:hypothetical protein
MRLRDVRLCVVDEEYVGALCEEDGPGCLVLCTRRGYFSLLCTQLKLGPTHSSCTGIQCTDPVFLQLILIYIAHILSFRSMNTGEIELVLSSWKLIINYLL